MDTKWNGTGSDGGRGVEYFVAAQVREAAERAEAAPPRKRGTAVKSVIGFLAFFLGLSLTLGSLGAMAGRIIAQRGSPLEWSGDWQQTQEFRDQVSAYLREFLSLGATGTTGNAWYAAQESVVIAGDDYREVHLYNEARPSEELVADFRSAGPEWEPVETAPGDAYRQDKNVLYLIMDEGRIRYSNITGNSARQFRNRSFEGYNFYLTYEDGKVTIFKDGTELDVYGDGMFDAGSSPWFVPGYENLRSGDWLEGITVYMSVRQEPVRYWVQDSSGGQYYYGRMYRVAQRIEETRQFYLRQAALLGVGALCLCVWLTFRKEKRLAAAKVASWTGHVWTEVWLVLAAAPVVWLIGAGAWQDLYWACREIWWNYESLHLGQLAYGVANFFLTGLRALLATAFFLWLLYNNCRYNPRETRRSLLRSLFRGVWGLFRALRAADLKRPIEKRLTRTIAVGTAALALVLAVLVLGLAAMIRTIWNHNALWLVMTAMAAALALGVLVLLISSARTLRLGRDLGKLHDQVEAIRSGNLERPLDLPRDADLRKTAEALNDIQAGMKKALAEQTRSERMKVELISNVSHDLKTPLTSILSYAELLRQEELPPAAADYARIIDEKAQRLKSMVQDVFEVSKAASDQLPVELERLDLAKLLRQTLADLDDPIQKSGLTFRVDLPAEPVIIVSDGKRLYRVFQNLIDNALRYALAGSRVYLTLKTEGDRAETSVRNTSREELPEGVDFTARFVRGDESRTDGGSGLGLSIASSFTEACGGAFRVETVADLFTAVVTLPLAEKEETA